MILFVPFICYQGEFSLEKGVFGGQNKKQGLVFFWGDILKDRLTYGIKKSSQDVEKNSPRDLFQEYNIERRYCLRLLFVTREFALEKGFFGGQLNKKWGLVFFWGDILKDCLTYMYGMKRSSRDVKKNSPRGLFQECNIERRFCYQCLLFATREIFSGKGLLWGTNK